MSESEYHKEYYRKHKEEILKKHREHYQRNKEKYKERVREQRRKNPEERKKHDREYRRKHKDRINAQHRAYHKRRRRELKLELIKLLGGKCVKCGFIDWRALQIDHVHGGGTKEIRSFNNSTAYYLHVLKKIKNGSKDYQLLCANCNWIKSYEERERKY